MTRRASPLWKKSAIPERPLEIELDAETGLVTGLRLWRRGRDGRLLPEPEEYRYGDHREAAGLIVPFRTEEIRYGTAVSRLRLTGFSAARHGEIFSEP